ncbi:M48 family metallopeptidase [Nocardioides conyzicola]|uniref:Peptidase M48 domain-containing protein n=1 Tax=Nocardioides conyzicola TaxID=1651781 RepID=A0ABP8XS57_9ACTN
MEPTSLRARVDARIAAELDRRLVDRLVAAGGRARPAARVTSIMMATLVYLVVAALVAGGAVLIVLGDNWVQRAIGFIPLAPVVLLVRRRPQDDIERVDPAAAPEFSALVDEVAAVLGTPAPTFIGINHDNNAYAARTGVRSRSLVIGAPMWAAYTPAARIALLGHELGHFSHRDVVHGRYVGHAVQVLWAWVYFLTPDGLVSTEGRSPVFATIVTAPFRLPLLGYLALMSKVNAAASRHSELRADIASAQVAGTAAAVESLEIDLLGDLVDVAANRAAVDPARPHLGVEIRKRIAALSSDTRRAARVDKETSRVDRTHPPTVDRLRLVESLLPVQPAIEMDDRRMAAIDAELQPLLDRGFKRMADGYRYVW